MKISKSFSVLSSLLLLFPACQKDDVGEPSDYLEPYTFDGIIVDISNPWFAIMDDSSIEGAVETKSKKSTSSLESLLDFSSKQSISFGPKKITQIPFFSNSEPDYFCRFADEYLTAGFSADSLLISKKYFIETKEKGETFSYVANMLIDYSYARSIGIGNISYLEHPGFSGYIVFSDVYGNLLQISHYKWGEIKLSEIIRDENYDSSEGGIAIISPVIMTKTKGGDNEITPAIIVAGKPTRLKDDDSQDDNNKPDNSSYKSGGGGGSGSDGNKDGEDRESEQKRLDENKRIQEWLDGIQITSDTDKHLQQLKATLKELAVVDIDLLHNLLLSLSEGYSTGNTKPNILIKIQGGLINLGTSSRSVNGSFSGVTIYLPVDKIDEYSISLIAEEFFHAYQYLSINTSNDNRWKTGDMEFEGKIFDAYFYESYRSQYGYFSADDYFVFLKFAETRDSSSFDNAIKVLYNKFGYSKDDFPMNENMSYYNRTVHIDTLK